MLYNLVIPFEKIVMKNTIFFFVKFFEKKEFADDFMNGKLFLNRLSYFKSIEDQDNRGDLYEAPSSWLQPENIEFSFGGIQIPKSDFDSPVCIQKNKHNDLHLFCIYAAHSGHFDHVSDTDLAAFKKQFLIDDKCFKLGKYPIVILRVKTFIDRFIKAVRMKRFQCQGQLVEYYDPLTFHGSFRERAPFMKQKNYDYQKEFRFCIDTGNPGDGPFVFEIGDISDITRAVSPQDINQQLEIKLPS